MTSLKDIRLFTTQPHKCSYLPDQEAQTLFIDPEFQVESRTTAACQKSAFAAVAVMSIAPTAKPASNACRAGYWCNISPPIAVLKECSNAMPT